MLINLTVLSKPGGFGLRISKRREEAKQKLKDEIVQAALTLFTKDGYEKTSLRRIAKKIDYSPTTIYLHFQNKRELFLYLHDYLFEKFYTRLLSAHKIKNPFSRLKKMAKIYFDFAYSNQNYYRLMFIMHSPDARANNSNQWNFGIKSLNVLRETVGECMDKGFIKKGDLEAAVFTIWSFMHGVASLTIQERLKLYTKKELKGLTDKSLALLLGLIREESKQ